MRLRYPESHRCPNIPRAAPKCRLSRNRLVCNTYRGRLMCAAGTGAVTPGPGVPNGGGAGPISITFNGRVTLVPIYFFRSGAFQNFVYNTSMAVHELIYGPVGTNSPLRPSPAKNFVKFIVRPGNPGEPGGEHLWYIFLPVIALMAQTRYHSVYVPRFLLQNRCTAPH